MPTALLQLIHFNDVYRVTPQRVQVSGATSNIDVTQFAARVDSLRASWPEGQGLVLFSGDLFSPSVESSVTRGSHMVPVINQIKPDVSLTGNHDFDFGYPHLEKLMEACNFPWILSNIVDTETGQPPKGLERFKVFERSGLRIGVIGLVEQDWIATIGSWPPNFQYQVMEDVGIELSKLLRDPRGDYKCDMIVALTHSRIPNDIALAKRLWARPELTCASKHGVDIIFGGHDHMYYIGKGIKEWEGYDFDEPQLGTEADDGLFIVKSGTDFRDLSAMEVEVIDAPEGSIRRKVVKSIQGKHHVTAPEDPSSESMKKLLSTLLKDVGSALKKPVCKALIEFDCRSGVVRTDESAAGNWFADVLRHAYDDALCMKGCGGADGVLICGGVIRGDTVYGPGLTTMGDIMEILPFEDPMVVVAVDGATLWTVLESALSKWPAQEGRFPIISGFRLEWDSRRPPGQRVLGIWVEKNGENGKADHSDFTLPSSRSQSPVRRHNRQNGEEVSREPGGKKYAVVTRDYMATGHDGYDALKGCEFVGGVDEEHGQIMSAIVRKYLLGAQYIKHIQRLVGASVSKFIVKRASTHESDDPKNPQLPKSSSVSGALARKRWLDVGLKVIAQVSAKHDKAAICEAMRTSKLRHMSPVDAYNGERGRKGRGTSMDTELPAKADGEGEQDETVDLLEVAPVVDGRLKNVGKDAKVEG